MKIECPQCDGVMAPRGALRSCGDCGAHWVKLGPGFRERHPGAFEALVGLDAERGRRTDWDCPECAEELRSVVCQGVELDLCVGCSGVHFDRDEFARLSEQAKAPGSPDDPAESALRSFAQFLVGLFSPLH